MYNVISFFRYAEKNNLPVLEHVTYPRLTGFNSILEAFEKSSVSNGKKRKRRERSYVIIIFPQKISIDK